MQYFFIQEFALLGFSRLLLRAVLIYSPTSMDGKFENYKFANDASATVATYRGPCNYYGVRVVH